MPEVNYDAQDQHIAGRHPQQQQQQQRRRRRRRTLITPNIYLSFPPQGSTPPPPNLPAPTIIFFITGNPGLIGYYHEFLNRLTLPHTHLPNNSEASSTSSSASRSTSTSKPTTVAGGDTSDLNLDLGVVGQRCVVVGFSLGGFEVTEYVVDDGKKKDHRRGDEGEGDDEDDDGGDDGEGDGGFTAAELTVLENLRLPPGFKKREVYTLREQIELCYLRLCAVVDVVGRRSSPTTPQTTTASASARTTTEQSVSKGETVDGSSGPVAKIDVILMGHSVGAYIALEMTRMHRDRGQQLLEKISLASTPSLTPASTPAFLSTTASTSASLACSPTFGIPSLVLLTPTILNIAHSPSGRIATPLLTYMPFLPRLLHLGAAVLTTSASWMLPSRYRLEWLVSKITGMPLSSDGLKTTVAFLDSERGVRQALEMARQEMMEIGAGDEKSLWWLRRKVVDTVDAVTTIVGKDSDNSTWPGMYFWFAKRDHWVADVTRDEIVRIFQQRKEAGDEVRGELVVDEKDGLVHAWCIEQSDLVARRVRKWVQEIINTTQDEKACSAPR